MISALVESLSGKPVVLVGMMGAGKSLVGGLLAARLGRAFVDADAEIEASANSSIGDYFERYGEDAFRDGEERVIERLMRDGDSVIATGGGAFNSAKTRAGVRARGVSVWLKADIDVLLERVSRRDNRPLLRTGDRRAVLERLAGERYPFYAEADVTVEAGNDRPARVVDRILEALAARFAGGADAR